MASSVPLISFTFDDFPRSALLAGGKILRERGLAGTYYVALGLLGTEGPSGRLCDVNDLTAALAEGHELGSHTYSHSHSWNTASEAFEDSVIKNRAALESLIPHATFKSFSFPISEPRPLTKRNTAKHFLTCRAGGQTFNSGTADLNQLRCYFLEQSRGNLQAVTNMIDKNREARGWLVFGTHDVAENPSPFGCTPSFFTAVVEYSIRSGAHILPVVDAFSALKMAKAEGSGG